MTSELIDEGDRGNELLGQRGHDPPIGQVRRDRIDDFVLVETCLDQPADSAADLLSFSILRNSALVL